MSLSPLRLPTLRLAMAGLVVLTWAVLGGSTPALADTSVDEVHYTFTGPTSVALDWRGDAQDVRYGLTVDYGSTAVGSAPDWTPPTCATPRAGCCSPTPPRRPARRRCPAAATTGAGSTRAGCASSGTPSRT